LLLARRIGILSLPKERQVRFSKVIEQIQEYPFAKIGRIANAVEQRDAVPVIRATVGNPDREAPAVLKECMTKFILQERSTYGYPCDIYPRRGIHELIEAIIADYHEKYGVHLAPENIAVTSWAKETLHNLVRLFGPGKVQVPDPVYPVYESATTLSSNVVERVKTTVDSGWLPEFDLKKPGTVTLYFCDPNNPTGSLAKIGFYRSLVEQMKNYKVGGIFDKAYKDYTLDRLVKPVSITQIPGLMDWGFEVYSFSKHYNLVGIGLGWVVSSEENIDTWLRLSSHLNQGVAWYKQKTGVEALTNVAVKQEMNEYLDELRIRQRILAKGLNSLGLKTEPSAATPYLWVAVPESYSDEDFVINTMIDKAHVAFTPGSYFGNNGRGYFRTTLFMTKDKIEEALDRIAKVRTW
jgi:LL-diaminopimelate aminotransferase